MRQASVIAAASLYAFEHHAERLAEDHDRARRLAAGLADAGYSVELPETNIVLIHVGGVQDFLQALAQRGVLAIPGNADHVGLCTHLDLGDEEIRHCHRGHSRARYPLRRTLTLSPRIEVRLVASHEHAEPLFLLEEYMRDDKSVPPSFAVQLQRLIGSGDLEVFAARTEERLVGIAVLAFRPNVSAGTFLASIEDLYVRPDTRRRGVGQALLEAMGERGKVRGVSYVEVQTDDEAAGFYSVLGYEPQPGVQVLSRSYTL